MFSWAQIQVYFPQLVASNVSGIVRTIVKDGADVDSGTSSSQTYLDSDGQQNNVSPVSLVSPLFNFVPIVEHCHMARLAAFVVTQRKDTTYEYEFVDLYIVASDRSRQCSPSLSAARVALRSPSGT